MNPPGRVARLLTGVVRLYQLVISPYLSPRCRFLPSCSAYALEALQTHGAGRGGWLALRRVARCHPLCHGGWDPVPERPLAGQADADAMSAAATTLTTTGSSTGLLSAGADRGVRSC